MNWLKLLDQERVGAVILDRRSDRELVARLRRRQGWTVDFEDKESVIFTRNPREDQASLLANN